jgi:hypothetical protein
MVSDLFADALASSLNVMGDIFDPDDLPNPMEFIPDHEGYEIDLFQPNPARSEIFKALTFIFLDEKQHDNLATPINAGMGKAVIFDAQRKTVNDLANYANAKGQSILVLPGSEEGDKLCQNASRR